MEIAPPSKLITCILPRGKGMVAIKALNEELGIVTANVNHARGAGRMTPYAFRGVGETTEKDILTVVVPAEQANEVFAFLFDRADIDRPHGGLIFQQNLRSTTPFTLPVLPQER